MAITADVVKKLRDITGAGMMDCKKALTQANGDFAAAEKILKEMGLAAIAKRQDRATDNGRVFLKVQDNKAIMAELSCETDFVASNDQFQELGNNICAVALEKGYTEINDELVGMVNDLNWQSSRENMALKTLCVYDPWSERVCFQLCPCEVLWPFSSCSRLTRLSCLLQDVVKEFTNDCALHVAAFTPTYLNTAAVDGRHTSRNRPTSSPFRLPTLASRQRWFEESSRAS